MPLDEYKTQVLLLHSEQTTLDRLSSGFGDSYTVHCATSGSEALNTLGDTPINVIVTAQNLPGMSGLEALREAKKRSPDTIGILLAGNSNEGLEALVGEDKLFEVVRGSVTSESITKMVENATQQMRLMALAQSANDTAANMDEPAEHIVMETSDNGSTIISDGTGRLPALDPTKVSAAASVGSRSVDILVLTKDQEFLETIKDSSRGMHKVYVAHTLAQANEAISKQKVGVAVVDAAMVGEKVEQLTQHLRKGSPRLVSIVAGRRDDGEMLMDLINRGKVYRFLLKPVSPGRARLAVEASVKHHLEAPDAAFKLKGAAAAAAKAAPAAKQAAAPRQAPVQPAAPKPAPQTAARSGNQNAATPAPSDPPLGSFDMPEGDALVENGLSEAFGDDSSFTETVTGLISTVTARFSSDKSKNETAKPAAATAPTPSLSPSSIPAPTSMSVAADEDSGGSIFTNVKLIGIAAIALAIVAAGAFWMMSGSDGIETDAVAGNAASDVAAGSAPTAESLISDARFARDAGQWYSPAGDNAVELFAAALEMDPANNTVAAELDAAIAKTLALAETALLEDRLADAEAALLQVTAAQPDNARLPFLSTQLAQTQLRGRLDQARAAIRDERFEDASNALAAARSLGVEDTSEIQAIARELEGARGQEQAGNVLAKATARLDAGELLAPVNDNARYYFQLVLSQDPGNVIAEQGLKTIAGQLALRARNEINKGNFDSAEAILANAKSIDSSSSEVQAALATLRDARAAQERAVEADRRAEVERAAAARQAAADQAAQEERDRLAEIAAAEQAAAERAAQQQAAAAEPVAAEPANDVAESADTGAEEDAPVVAAATLEAAGPPQAAVGPPQSAAVKATPAAPIAASALNRTKYVAPKYPRSAQRRNVSGWVDVVFTVAIDGTVKNVEVQNSEPGDTFVSAAVNAVERWEFEPVTENGSLVEKRAGVRMMFALE